MTSKEARLVFFGTFFAVLAATFLASLVGVSPKAVGGILVLGVVCWAVLEGHLRNKGFISLSLTDTKDYDEELDILFDENKEEYEIETEEVVFLGHFCKYMKRTRKKAKRQSAGR